MKNFLPPDYEICESRELSKGLRNIQEAGTSTSRRNIQGSKTVKRLPSVKYSLLQYSKIKNISKSFFRKNYILKKMDRVARRGPLAQAPGALKGPFRNGQHFCRS